MLTAKEVSLYFLNKDKKKKLFNKNIVDYNNHTSYEGNIRLNKYLFLSQVVYLAKYNQKLFLDDFLAYDNGPVINEVMNSYLNIINTKEIPNIDESKKVFLDKIYESLKNATYEELIEITHEDPEWQRLSSKTYKTPVSCEPICVANLILCASPPDKVFASLSSVKYSRPTLIKNESRDLISFKIKSEISSCSLESFKPPKNAYKSLILSCVTS